MKIIITEQQNEKLNRKIRLAVGKLGLVQAREMFGDEIIKQAFIDNPSSFLDPFRNLKLEVDYDDADDYYYVDENGNRLIYYSKTLHQRGQGSIFFDYKRIYSFFDKVMNFDWPEIDPIFSKFLEENYNHTGQSVSYLDMTGW